MTALREIHVGEPALTDTAAPTIGSFYGGTAANVILDFVEREGSIRTFEGETRTSLKKRAGEISLSIASAFRTTAQRLPFVLEADAPSR